MPTWVIEKTNLGSEEKPILSTVFNLECYSWFGQIYLICTQSITHTIYIFLSNLQRNFHFHKILAFSIAKLIQLNASLVCHKLSLRLHQQSVDLAQLLKYAKTEKCSCKKHRRMIHAYKCCLFYQVWKPILGNNFMEKT